jgi:hypothetical protein
MAGTWNYWINEPVYLDDGVTNILKRKQAIYLFCSEGLVPFIESAGFRMVYDRKELTRILLRLLYMLSIGTRVKPVRFYERPREELYEYYCHSLDTKEWEGFWSTWGSFQDFQPDRFGYCLRSSLSEFVWSWLDLEYSPAFEGLLKELEAADSLEEGAKGKDDPYLQETSKRDYQDRHW